jgi:LacI family transcriptional regulator
MKDVAERAGVSVTTVSHVVNRTRPVAPETLRRVESAIEELNFYKNVHARRLARGGSDFLGLIVSDIANPFFPELIKSFEAAALECGFDLLLFNTDYHLHRTEAAVRKMIENKVRGVAVMTSEFAPGLAEDLEANHVSVVFLDHGDVRDFVSDIRVDYSSGISDAIRHLFDLGHRDFAFIAGPQNLKSAVIRRKAFIETVSRWGMTSHRTLESNHKVEGGVEAVKVFLAQPNFPTAILCSNDLTAIGALSALHQAGLKIPDDVSVVGFDDIFFASVTHPPLTTVSLSRARLGQLAFEALERMLHHKTHRGAEYVVETRLLVRQSTGPSRESKGEGTPKGAASQAHNRHASG